MCSERRNPQPHIQFYFPLTVEIILLSAPEVYDVMDAMNLALAENGKGNTKHGDDRHLELDPGHSCVY